MTPLRPPNSRSAIEAVIDVAYEGRSGGWALAGVQGWNCRYLFEPAKISSPFAEVVVALPPNAPELSNCSWPFKPPRKSKPTEGVAQTGPPPLPTVRTCPGRPDAKTIHPGVLRADLFVGAEMC